MISREYQILAAVGRLDPDEEQLQEIRKCMSGAVDINRLIGLAVKEGLAGFLYRSLLKTGLLDEIDPNRKQELSSRYYLTIRHNLKLIHATNEIYRELNRINLRVVLMQGVALLLQVYRDAGLRPMKDIDLWVLPGQYAAVVNCLIGLGFSRSPIYPDTFIRGMIILDIRRHLLGGDRIRRRDMLITIDQEDVFKRTCQVAAGSTTARCLDPADQFLYLTQHAFKHNLERLIWLVDLTSMTAAWEPSNWNDLMDRGRQLGQQNALYCMLHILKNMFKIELPPALTTSLQDWKPGSLERRVLERRINGNSISTWSQLMLLSKDKGLHDKIAFFKETLFPRPKILRQVFPDACGSSNRQLYWKRVLQIIGSLK